MEFSIPVMFDVTAESREAAGQGLVKILSDLGLPGKWDNSEYDRRAVFLESWWTIDARDKQHDGNDNDAGTVVFGGAVTGARGESPAERGVWLSVPGAATPEAVVEAALLYALEHSVDDDSILTVVREYLTEAD